jgi:hypothetical protein
MIFSEAYQASVESLREDLESFPLAEWRRAIRVGTEGEFRRWLDSSSDCVFYGLILHARDAEVAEWLAAAAKQQLDFLEPFHARMLRVLGRRCRPGISPRQFGGVLRSVVAGLALDARVPGSPTKDRVTVTEADPELAGEWFLATLAIEALVMGLTEPMPPE